jgi:hypothetical protein
VSGTVNVREAAKVDVSGVGDGIGIAGDAIGIADAIRLRFRLPPCSKPLRPKRPSSRTKSRISMSRLSSKARTSRCRIRPEPTGRGRIPCRARTVRADKSGKGVDAGMDVDAGNGVGTAIAVAMVLLGFLFRHP